MSVIKRVLLYNSSQAAKEGLYLILKVTLYAIICWLVNLFFFNEDSISQSKSIYFFVNLGIPLVIVSIIEFIIKFSVQRLSTKKAINYLSEKQVYSIRAVNRIFAIVNISLCTLIFISFYQLVDHSRNGIDYWIVSNFGDRTVTNLLTGHIDEKHIREDEDLKEEINVEEFLDQSKGVKPYALTQQETNDSLVYRALFLANQNYLDPDISSLDYPINEAKELRSILINKYGFKSDNVSTLFDFSEGEFLSAMDSLVATIDENDLLLIFYSGHGEYDESLNEGYWLAIDSELENKSAWIQNSTIVQYLSEINSHHTLLIIDSCFSGSFFMKKYKGNPKNQSKNKSRKALTSTLDKKVPDKSLFHRYLMKALADNNEQFISAENIYDYLKEPVEANSNNTPKYEILRNTGHEGGEFVFRKSPELNTPNK